MQHSLPAGFTVRRPTMDDVPSVVAMAQVKERIEDGSVSTTEENLRRCWQAPDYDLS